MLKLFLLIPAVLLMLVGCGVVDTTATQDSNTIEEPVATATNCFTDSPTNGLGDCYGSNVLFPGATGELVTQGIWSVYTRSNLNRTDNTIFYDRYKYSLNFVSNGTAVKRENSEQYLSEWLWGISDAGATIYVSDPLGSYTYTATFSGQTGCYEVNNNGTTYKFCHEFLINLYSNTIPTPQNTMGYYSDTVRFGNYGNFSFTAAGTWSFTGYGDNTLPGWTVTLGAAGLTDPNGGEWGVSADGKVIGIEGTYYIFSQVFESPYSNCFAVYELANGAATATAWRMCKG